MSDGPWSNRDQTRSSNVAPGGVFSQSWTFQNFGSGQQRKGFEPLVPKFGFFCRGIIINTMVLIHVGWTMVKQRSNEEFKRGPRRRFFSKVGHFKTLEVGSSEKVSNRLFQSLGSFVGVLLLIPWC